MEQLFPQPSALGMGGRAQPLPTLPAPHLRYSLSSLLAALSGKVRYEELVFLTRGSRSLRSMAVQMLGLPGEGEEEAAESERGEAAWRCLTREICASWVYTRLPLSRKLGGAGKPAGGEPRGDCDGDRGVLQPSPCQAPPNPPPAGTRAGMVLPELCSPAESSLC